MQKQRNFLRPRCLASFRGPSLKYVSAVTVLRTFSMPQFYARFRGSSTIYAWPGGTLRAWKCCILTW